MFETKRSSERVVEDVTSVAGANEHQTQTTASEESALKNGEDDKKRKGEKSAPEDNDEGLNQNEVDLYLMEPLEKTNQNFDILNWWKVNSTKYPTLGQIAKDLLAMLVSTIASESAFSTGGRILISYRRALTPKTVEALLCCQNWLRSTKLTTDVEELVEEFEKLEIEFVPPQQSNDEDSCAESD